MRVAAIYDLHGNLPALEAVAKDIKKVGVDRVVFGGDLLPGPMPRECLEFLMNLDAEVNCILGNGEIDALDLLNGREIPRVPPAYHPVVEWSARQITKYKNEIATWPRTLRLDIEGCGEVLFCHATPRDDNEIFTKLTPAEELTSAFENLDTVVCGHTHMPFDRRIGRTRVVNAGSLGMPFGKTGADWLLLGPDIRFCHTDYDWRSAAKRFLDTDYPQVRDHVRALENPPTEEQMLKIYSRSTTRR